MASAAPCRVRVRSNGCLTAMPATLLRAPAKHLRLHGPIPSHPGPNPAVMRRMRYLEVAPVVVLQALLLVALPVLIGALQQLCRWVGKSMAETSSDEGGASTSSGCASAHFSKRNGARLHCLGTSKSWLFCVPISLIPLPGEHAHDSWMYARYRDPCPRLPPVPSVQPGTYTNRNKVFAPPSRHSLPPTLHEGRGGVIHLLVGQLQAGSRGGQRERRLRRRAAAAAEASGPSSLARA